MCPYCPHCLQNGAPWYWEGIICCLFCPLWLNPRSCWKFWEKCCPFCAQLFCTGFGAKVWGRDWILFWNWGGVWNCARSNLSSLTDAVRLSIALENSAFLFAFNFSASFRSSLIKLLNNSLCSFIKDLKSRASVAATLTSLNRFRSSK